MDLPGKLAGALLMLCTGAATAEPLRLETQFGETVPILGDGQARIIAYADQEGAGQTADWGEALESIPCPVVAVANLAGVPELARAMVRDGFRDEDPVALDWQGKLAERLYFEAGRPNVYLLDSRGEVQLHLHGAAGEADLSRLRSLARRSCAGRS